MNLSWDGEKEIQLLPCPFCGTIPEIRHIGNDYSKKCAIKIKCKKCRIERIDATLKFDFEWLETVAVKNWNERI